MCVIKYLPVCFFPSYTSKGFAAWMWLSFACSANKRHRAKRRTGFGSRRSSSLVQRVDRVDLTSQESPVHVQFPIPSSARPGSLYSLHAVTHFYRFICAKEIHASVPSSPRCLDTCNHGMHFSPKGVNPKQVAEKIKARDPCSAMHSSIAVAAAP